MRISHKRKKDEPKKTFFFNEGIKAPSVFVLTDEGNLGVMNTGEAIRTAREQELDLVEINPKANPPVAKIMNFGQYQYQQEKEARLRKAHTHVTKVKVIRLSLRIGQHDLEIRQKQVVDFLNSGDKAKVEVFLRGRENQQAALAFEIVKKFVKDVNTVVPTRFDQEAEKQGNVVSVIITKA